ncbi:hypothetical protein AVEN_270101-1 [Araneus ventricosus]|uniref:Uncharacterized protein n=1 Tax=Araneus ventricosus TaxID=182803 RepID=A0A4Y2U6J2_ARAVE|nr:hypothetical protein AVEN_197755-1 [Araneus ventricosus]GBO08431.1 hypothetical protein AVEN_270101-1 [Araneus ventricosus]
MLLAFHLSRSPALFDQNSPYRLKFFFSIDTLYTPVVVLDEKILKEKLERVVVSEMLAPALLPPTILHRSKSLKSLVLHILTLTSVITTSPDAERSLYQQLCFVTSFYVTTGPVNFQIKGDSNLLSTQCR